MMATKTKRCIAWLYIFIRGQLLLMLLTGVTLASNLLETVQTDICIYGATSAGVITAIQSAREGHQVTLIATGQHLGGMSTEGLGSSDIDNHRDFQNSTAIGGLTLEFYRRLARFYNRLPEFDSSYAAKIKNSSLWNFESSSAEQIFLQWLAEYDRIQIFYGERLTETNAAVDKVGTQIRSITTENGRQFRARVFIDATYEGDLLARAGISYTIGREANATYGETKNGIRCSTTYRQFQVSVDPYVVPGDSSSGLIHTIQSEPMGECGAGDHRSQAFCFRMCLTQDTSNQISFAQPQNYRRDWYEIYLRYLQAGGQLYTPRAGLPNGKTDLGAWHDLSHNLYGFSHDYSDGSYATRDSIYQYHRDFTAGLFYFLSHDSAVPKPLRAEWASWGLAKDEFTDNRGWPRSVYIRDGRRLVSDYVITEAHTRQENPTVAEDPVGVAFWPPDVHHVRRIVQDGRAFNEGFVFGGDDWKPFGISYRALVPKESECTNLLTPTCPSSSHIGYGSIRLEWTFMVSGQSVASAASIMLRENLIAQQVPYKRLKEKLLSDKQVLSLQ